MFGSDTAPIRRLLGFSLIAENPLFGSLAAVDCSFEQQFRGICHLMPDFPVLLPTCEEALYHTWPALGTTFIHNCRRIVIEAYAAIFSQWEGQSRIDRAAP